MNFKDTLKIDFSSFKVILFAALIVRVIAAIFSQGYGMHDDHFLVVEASTSWVDGYDYNGWLPWSDGNRGKPEGHSFSYVGLNYIFFYIVKFFGFSDPKVLMILNRLFHGLLSLLVVYFGMKITEQLSNRKNAVTVGWLLALLSVMPFLAVRNLVELAALPYLIWGVWLLVKPLNLKLNLNLNFNLLYAGLLIGLAVSFRYQIAVFAIAVGAYYFFKWQFKNFFLFTIGLMITFGITQGFVDYLIWGYPFAEFISYSTYNMEEGTQYLPNSNYFMYFWVLMGVLLFPLGLLVCIGFFRSAKKYFLIFLPTLAFILFHTFYPNRQERFVLTILPFFIILGVIGYQSLKEKAFWSKLWNVSMVIFWILNIPLMTALCFHYSKKSRVEAMYALYQNKIKDERILLEGSRSSKPSQMPKFYADSWYCSFTERADTSQTLIVNEGNVYDYIFFFGDEDLEKRIKEYKVIYPKLRLVKKCEPSLIDNIARTLNPRNSNQYIEVWETRIPEQK